MFSGFERMLNGYLCDHTNLVPHEYEHCIDGHECPVTSEFHLKCLCCNELIEKDPTRCQHSRYHSRCKFEALPGKIHCALHDETTLLEKRKRIEKRSEKARATKRAKAAAKEKKDEAERLAIPLQKTFEKCDHEWSDHPRYSVSGVSKYCVHCGVFRDDRAKRDVLNGKFPKEGAHVQDAVVVLPLYKTGRWVVDPAYNGEEGVYIPSDRYWELARGVKLCVVPDFPIETTKEAFKPRGLTEKKHTVSVISRNMGIAILDHHIKRLRSEKYRYNTAQIQEYETLKNSI